MARKSDTMAKAAKAAAAKNNHETMKAMKAMKRQKAMKALNAMKTKKAMKTKMSAKPAAEAPGGIIRWIHSEYLVEYPESGWTSLSSRINGDALAPKTADIAQRTGHPELSILHIPELTENEQTQLIERARIALSRLETKETAWKASDLIISLLRSGISLGLTPLDKMPKDWCAEDWCYLTPSETSSSP